MMSDVFTDIRSCTHSKWKKKMEVDYVYRVTSCGNTVQLYSFKAWSYTVPHFHVMLLSFHILSCEDK